MKNIETPIDDGGNITVGAFKLFDCVASAADDHMCFAMLVRREDETLGAWLNRPNKAIGLARSDDIFADEVNTL